MNFNCYFIDISREPPKIQSYSRLQQPSRLTPAMTSETLETIIKNIARTNKNEERAWKSIEEMWLSEVLMMSSSFSNDLHIIRMKSHGIHNTIHYTIHTLRSCNSLPAKASDRIGLTAETCREVTIFARHERPLKGFWTVYACSSWSSWFWIDFQRMTEKFRGHSIWFQSSNILPVYDRDYDSDTCTKIRIPVWFRVEPCGF